MLYINLTKGKRAIVDEEDYEWVSKHKWTYANTGYVKRNTNKDKRTYLLHREILKAKKGQIVDHINRNKLDNRRSNLRIASRSQNAFNSILNKRNTSGYRGVCWDKRHNFWVADLQGKRIGYFKTKIEAALAYEEAVKKLL